MRLSHFFVDRPIFAAVMSIIVTLVEADRGRAFWRPRIGRGAGRTRQDKSAQT